MKTALIYNGHASKGKVTHKAENILSLLSEAKIDADLMMTQKKEDAVKLAESAVVNGYERIIAAGGDGTVNEVANGIVLAEKKGFSAPLMGIIPIGRGNDFCFCLNIPLDIQEAVSIIAKGHAKSIDVGCAGDGTFERYFVNGSGFGIDAAINYRASLSKLNGFPSYVWGLIKALFLDWKRPLATIEIDGVQSKIELLLFTAMNGKREGGGFVLAPNFDLSDGLLNICYVGDKISFFPVIKIISQFFSGKLSHPSIRACKAKKVSVHVEGDGLISQVDGETIFVNGKRFISEIAPWKINLICPENFD